MMHKLMCLQVQLATVLRTKLQDRDVTIAVITPYRAQKNLVINEMPENVDAKILTINECQGLDNACYALHNS